MTIGQRATNAWADNNATTQTVTLPTHATGDMLVVRCGLKAATPASVSVTIGTAGWTKIGQANNGTTASGIGSGSVVVAAFYKIAASAAETNPVITWGGSQTATPGCANATSYSKAAGETWVTPVGAGAGFTSATTTPSITMPTHHPAQYGDMLDHWLVVADDTTMTLPAISQAGLAAYAASAENPAAALLSTTSNDLSADGGFALCGPYGESTAAAVISGTLSTVETGTAYYVRLRVTPGPNQTLGPALINQTAVAHAPEVAVGAAPSAYNTAVLVDSPVAYYKLGEASGHFADSIAGGLSSTAEGGHTYDATGALLGGQDDGAYHLSGGGAGIDIPDQARLDLGSGPWTIELWANLDTHKDYNTLIGKHTGAYQITVQADQSIILVVAGSHIDFQNVDGLSLGVWHHIVWTRTGQNNAENHLYVDGVERTLIGTGSPYVNNSADLHIGYEGPDAEFTDGKIDEVALYSTALSQARVQAHYLAAGYGPYASAVVADGPLSYYRMGEASGAVVDAFGGRNGTVTGTVTRDVTGLITSGAGDDGAISHAGSGYWTADWPASMGQVWTIEVWINVTLGAATTVLSGLSNHYMYYGSGGTLSCAAGNVAVNSTGGALTAGIHHVVWSRAGTLQAQNKLYVDGVDVSVASGFDSTHGTITTLRVGEYIDGSESFLGTMDELAIYNTALSQARVQAHYTAAGYSLSGTQGLTLGLINRTAVATAPSVQPGVRNLTVAQITQTAVIHQPSVQPGVRNLTVALITQTAVPTAPTVSSVRNLTVALISQVATATAPVITTGVVNVTLAQITRTAVTHAPGVIPDQDYSPALINQTAVASAPSITLGLGVPVWTTPADGVSMVPLPVLAFTLPMHGGPLHFQIDIDDNSGFSSPTTFDSSLDQTGWEYNDPSLGWLPVTSGGVVDEHGRPGRYTVQSPLTPGTIYRRVRAGVVS